VKQRIDSYLVKAGFFESREQAQRAIMAGQVLVNGKRVEKPGQTVAEPLEITVERPEHQYVSRGAHKLVKALEAFPIEVAGKVCLDAGASTGGFTDVLLQNGARLVYAVDVGYGQLAWKLRQDPRVMVFERQNIRYFEADNLPERPSLITADLSFISLKLLFDRFKALITADGQLMTLIKPQFEAGREHVGKKGVVRDRRIHAEVIRTLAELGPVHGWHLAHLTFSPILGPEGNIEFLGHWIQESAECPDIQPVVDAAWRELKNE